MSKLGVSEPKFSQRFVANEPPSEPEHPCRVRPISMTMESEQVTAEQVLKLRRLMDYLALDEKNTSLILEALVLATDLQDWERARLLIKLSSDVEHAPPHLRAATGFAQLCLGDYPRATESLALALDDGLHNNDVTYNLAYGYVMLLKSDEALTALERLDDCYAQSARAQLLRARALLIKDEVEEAVRVLEELSSDKEASAESFGLLSLALYESDHDRKTVAQWADRALLLDQKNHEALVAHAWLLLDQGDFQEAQDVLRSIVSYHPKSGRGWGGLAQVEFSNFRFDEALDAASNAVELSPTNLGFLHLLGWCHVMKGEAQNALEVFQRAYTLDRSFGETHAGLAVAYFQTSQKTKARRHLKLAEKLNTDGFGIILANMLALESEGKGAQALDLFESSKKSQRAGLGGRAPADLINKHLKKLGFQVK